MKELKIPKYIRKKISEIVYYDIKINRLIKEIKDWKPIFWEAEIPPENWQWDMYFRNPQDTILSENIIERLKDAWASHQKKIMKEKMTKKRQF